jgi:hypothetical protein
MQLKIKEGIQMKLKKLCVFALAFVMLASFTAMSYASPLMDGTTDDGSIYVQKEDNKLDPLTEKQLE